MAYDYTLSEPNRDRELIPAGTIASIQIHVRPGGAGEGGILKRSARGDCEMLDLQFTVVDGPFAHRKFWGLFILEGTSDGHAKAAEISRGTLRTIIESAKGIQPNDVSAAARAARTCELKDFDGLIFIGRIGVEKGRPKNDGNGDYPDKNILSGVITPGHKDWHPVAQPAPAPWNGGNNTTAASMPAPAPGIAKPSWAQ